MTRKRPLPLGWVLFAAVAFVSPLLLTGCADENAQTSSPSAIANEPTEGADKSIVNSIGLQLVRIPAGEFLMGSTDKDANGREDEKPQHRVRIIRPFYLGAYEVTQREYETVMETNPSFFSHHGPVKDRLTDLDCSQFPADDVTWYDAVNFCRRLSESPAEKAAGRVYRLPTEAEWEYACRAGTTTVFYFGDSLSSAEANFNGNYPFGAAEKGPFLSRTTAVGSYAPNAFGLYDMHGNVNEWCADRFSRDYYRVSPVDDPTGPTEGTSPVIRGGDWYSDARDCRSAFRYADIPEGTFYVLGFRVVCELVRDGGPDAAVAITPEAFSRGTTHTATTDLNESPMPTAGEDWPRWRGPRGDGSWLAPKLVSAWPEGGLQRVWRNDLGGGYGGVSVSGGRVYVMDRQEEPEEVERVLCFDGADGELLWSHSYPVDYSGVDYGNGPRTTPTVFRGRVFTLGAVGHLHCLDSVSGRVVWSKDLVRDFHARVPLWGLSASPIVYEDLLIVHPGAEPDGCYIAFDYGTGEERWRSLPDAAGYATPIIIDHGGVRQLVGWTPTNVRGLDPTTGAVQWTIPFEVNFGTAIANPIFRDEMVLVSSYYDGAMGIRLGDAPNEASVAWQDRRNLRALMAQPLYRDGYVYLLDKRHGLTCFRLATGKKLWDDDNRMTPKGRNPQATMVWLNDQDRVIVLISDGELILARFRPEGYQEEARTKIIGRTWAHPAYAGNCVYARSDSEIVCVLLPRAEGGND